MDSAPESRVSPQSDGFSKHADTSRPLPDRQRPLTAEQLIRARTWVEVDLQALAANVAAIRKRIAPAGLLVVIKKDAYGHGLLPVARALEESGVDFLGVACVGEGLALRSAGVAAPILNLGLALEEEIESAITADIELTVATLHEARNVAEMAKLLGRTARLHLKIDTGMGRLGLFPEQLLHQVDAMARLPHVEWVGLYSHLADNPGNARLTNQQLDRFQKVAGALGDWLTLRQLGASGAIDDRRLHFDLLRVGIAAYGADVFSPNYESVMSFKSRIVFIKDFPAGRTISYGATFETREPTRVGVVAAGYGNGYPRLASSRSHVLVGGRPAPVLGRICMDQMMINLNQHIETQVGDPVLLFGRDNGNRLPVWEVAHWAETVAYEILCCVGTMNPRVYLRAANPGGKKSTGAVK